MRSVNWLAAFLVWMVCNGIAAADEYRHTIIIDGVNDFITSGESFPTTTTGYTAYATWDSLFLYGAYNGPEIATGDDYSWLLLYMDTGLGGTATGMQIGTQLPMLPFNADHAFMWRTDGLLSQLYDFNGFSWVDVSWQAAGNVAQSGSFVEYRFDLLLLGGPQIMDLVSLMVNETPGLEFTWAGMPDNAFTDGYNPSFADDHCLHIDFSSSAAPNGTPEPSTALLWGVLAMTVHGCGWLRPSPWRIKTA